MLASLREVIHLMQVVDEESLGWETLMGKPSYSALQSV
jgi:hypothetical protein